MLGKHLLAWIIILNIEACEVHPDSFTFRHINVPFAIQVIGMVIRIVWGYNMTRCACYQSTTCHAVFFISANKVSCTVWVCSTFWNIEHGCTKRNHLLKNNPRYFWLTITAFIVGISKGITWHAGASASVITCTVTLSIGCTVTGRSKAFMIDSTCKVIWAVRVCYTFWKIEGYG